MNYIIAPIQVIHGVQNLRGIKLLQWVYSDCLKRLSEPRF